MPESSNATVPTVDQVMSEPEEAKPLLAPATTSDNAAESALQHLNVDYSEGPDADSALGDMTPQNSTMSVQSSIYNYVEENGRTYHRYKEGKYMLPNDEAEKDRLDLQHQLWLVTLDDQLYLAPIKDPSEVLDVATGTGIWAIEFANRYPNSRVTGSDLSPIQPDFIPSNCHFEVDDAEDDWNYSQKFDLIHGRALATCFKDPAAVIASAFKTLAPGGYLEFQELVLPMSAIDDTLRGTSLETWQNKTMAAAVNMGVSWQQTSKYGRFLEQAGFINVEVRHFQWPMNTWPKGRRMKTLGSYFVEDMLRGLEGMSMAALTRGGGMAKEEVLELIAEVRKDLVNKAIHGYLPIIIIYGQKPQ